MVVPKKAKTRMDPMFLKKNLFFMLYPALKMMGGRITLKKISGSKVVFWSIYKTEGRNDVLI
jgi:hypothetical protein